MEFFKKREYSIVIKGFLFSLKKVISGAEKMKRASAFAGLVAGILALFAVSCESLDGLVQNPSAEIKSVTISGLDLEGISFNCNYAVKNPYAVDLSLAGITMNVDCKNSKVTSMSSSGGVKINASSTTTNSMSFKVPYTSIIELAQNYVSSKTLPFKIDGTISIDTSKVPLLSDIGTKSLDIPVSTDFEVPVFKPVLSVENFKVKMPTFNELKDQLTKGGLGITKAITIATKLISGEKLTADILDGISMNIDFTFDMKVENEGSADWTFDINDCAINSSNGKIAKVGPASSKSTISSKKASIPMKATLNTIEAGPLIIQMLNKSGTNPTFTLNSGLSFPGTSYAKNIPLNYSTEIPLSNIKK